jgi:hypothetical protein
MLATRYATPRTLHVYASHIVVSGVTRLLAGRNLNIYDSPKICQEIPPPWTARVNRAAVFRDGRLNSTFATVFAVLICHQARHNPPLPFLFHLPFSTGWVRDRQ